MRTDLDVPRYRMATDEQRSEVDRYLTDALDRAPVNVIALDATAEGAVRVTRYPAAGHELYVASYCPEGRCCHVLDSPGACTHHDYLVVRETLRPPVPPPWLAWPDPTDETDPDA